MRLIELLTEQPQAAFTILARTPVWVWGLFGGLVGIGILQMRTRSVVPARLLLLPVGLALFSLGGLARDWMSTRWLLPVMGLWWLAFAVSLLASRGFAPPVGARYEPHTQRVRLPGSAMPLLLIVTIFLVKYAVGVELALQPALREHAGFALGVAAASGALSGLLAKRSAGLWRFARQRTALAASAPAPGDAP